MSLHMRFSDHRPYTHCLPNALSSLRRIPFVGCAWTSPGMDIMMILGDRPRMGRRREASGHRGAAAIVSGVRPWSSATLSFRQRFPNTPSRLLLLRVIIGTRPLHRVCSRALLNKKRILMRCPPRARGGGGQHYRSTCCARVHLLPGAPEPPTSVPGVSANAQGARAACALAPRGSCGGGGGGGTARKCPWRTVSGAAPARRRRRRLCAVAVRDGRREGRAAAQLLRVHAACARLALKQILLIRLTAAACPGRLVIAVPNSH